MQSSELVDAAVDLLSRVRSIAGSKGAEHHEHGNDDSGKDHQLAEDRAGVAELLPLHAALTKVLLELLSTELVVDETAKGNGVAESLEECNRVLEKEHGREDQEDILEDTRKGEDERRSLANLEEC